MHTPSSEESDRAWADLVARLRQQTGPMKVQFFTRLTSLPGYAQNLVSTEELDTTAMGSLQLILDCLDQPDSYPDLLRFGEDLGARRARQGVPAEALISAVRLDFPVIWATLLQLSGPGDASLLTTRVEDVWKVVDDYAAAAHSSYLAERISMAREEAGVRQDFIAALFGPEGQLPETRSRFAAAFEVNPEGRFGIAAAQGKGAAALRQLASFSHRPALAFVHQSGNYTYVFWPETPGMKETGAVLMPAAVASLPCGVHGPVNGLAELASAARIAAVLSELVMAADRKPITVGSGWTRLTRHRMLEIGIDLRAAMDGQLAACRPDERARLEETVLCFLNSGSITETAEQLYCHRNTILNRLKRFKDLTGIELMKPVDAARAVVAWG
ncbi:helix-turn-helix domain-containing protein [Arthrobacter sp. H5]|uniref:PucR family transcriptional regulator n=1 Tax=Arthrobacter sp. H5 TaxID=1267973 RepID=UPI0012DF9176|nr:helix-turn-helix domain-containing protein [Arthrobacter sp. H5]